MKTLLLIIICICCLGIGAYCQTFSEWFFQKKTRIKRLEQQIAALEALNAVLQKGYSMAEKGVDSVHVIEQEGLVNDEDFIAHLRSVKPVIKYGPERVTCYELTRLMIKHVEAWRDAYSRNPWLKLREINLINAEFSVIVNIVNERLTLLQELISEDKMEMEDEERWDAISEIEMDIREAYESSNQCISGVMALIRSREQQAANDAYLKSLLQ
jgi:hypothetical protein